MNIQPQQAHGQVSLDDTGRRHYQLIARAIEYIEAHRAERPSLAQVADHVHLSEFHFQRLFTEWAGISPKRYLQYLTVEHAKRRLAESPNLSQLAFDLGLSGQSRLHDLFVRLEAMTPGQYRQQGQFLSIRYGFADSPFGEVLIASTDRGICHLAFLDAGRERALHDLREHWPLSELHESAQAEALAERVFSNFHDASKPLSVLVKGTNFQVQVWRALLNIPFGQLFSYRHMAGAIGKERASRAVGTAIAQNRVGYLIPCHRVIRQNGELSRYRWGSRRKGMMLAWEEAQASDAIQGAI
ncbi:MAG: bifunctional transcriptional activator/DNA repair enzyme AdaA [Gammaproteobacteria bacterium]